MKVITELATPTVHRSDRGEINKALWITFFYPQFGTNPDRTSVSIWPILSHRNGSMKNVSEREAIMLTELLQQVVLMKTMEEMQTAPKMYAEY